MKGITPIIALILLLVIVIVIVGFSFGIFQGLVQTAGETVETQTNTTTTQIQKSVVAESAAMTTGATTVSVRNIGGANFSTSELAVYKDGSTFDCTWDTATIAAGGIATCWNNTAVTACTEIKVTSPSGFEDTKTC